jgi:hypothetical protein
VRAGPTAYLRDPIRAAEDGLDDALGALADHAPATESAAAVPVVRSAT